MTMSALTADGRARVLNDGNQIPLLVLGSLYVSNGRECVNVVRCVGGHVIGPPSVR